MTRQKLFYLSMFLITSICMQSKNINSNEAQLIAKDFINNNVEFNTIEAGTRSSSLNLSYTANHHGEPTYYVFNISTGGYVIVSARANIECVIGYSTSDKFDYDLLNPEIRNWYNSFSESIANLPADHKYNGTRSETIPISPLLGNTTWNQMWPYNELCPIISGLHAPTGCGPTAYGQIMRYYQWPEHGYGQHSYLWNNETLSADFSQSEYDWASMKDSYDENSDEQSINAVATLMKDLGVAYEVEYSLGGSGAINSIEPLATYFGYSSNTQWMVGEYVSSKFFESTILQELSAGRPVVLSGSDHSCDYHAYVCDGVDQNGYFHINFGWGGSQNGYFLLTETGYSTGLDMYYQIRPEDGVNIPCEMYISLTNHFKYSELNNKFKFAGRWFGDFNPEENILAIENISNGNIFYLNKFENISSEEYVNIDVELNDIPNGDYILYPLYRPLPSYDNNIVGNWKKFEHNERYQGYVNVHISDNIIEITNPLIPDILDEGKVKIDNIYYELDEKKHTATVTYKNSSYGSYAGDIVIPESVIYQNNNYEVNSIGHHAFKGCDDLRSLTLANTITRIDEYGISASGLQTLRFPKKSKISKIDKFGSERCTLLVCLKLPSELTTLGMAALQGNYRIQYLSMPETYKMSNDDPLNMSNGIKSIRFNNPNPIDAKEVFFGVRPENMNLYVPMNSRDSYYEHPYWGTFPIHEYFSYDNCFYYHNENSDLTLLDGDMASDIIEIPSIINSSISNTNQQVTNIGHCAFYANNDLKEITLPSTISFIGDYAFANCENLKVINCRAEIPPILEENTQTFFTNKEWDCQYLKFRSFYGVNKRECVLQVPVGSKEKYLNAPEWNEFENIVEVDFAGIKEGLDEIDILVSFVYGNVEISNLPEHKMVKVYNLLGQLVYEGYENIISGLPKGSYIVKIDKNTYKGCL